MNPLDLFSEENTPKRRHLSSLYRPSSPIEETETIRELRLSEENDALIKRKKKLQMEIEELEDRWNKIQSKNKEELEILEKEEDEIIFKLLLQRADGNGDDNVNEDNDDDYKEWDNDEMVEFKAEDYDGRPLRDWNKRIQFIKRFYQDLEIQDTRSRLSLEYENNTKCLIKTISFIIKYSKLISFKVDVRLKKQEDSYKVWKLDIQKLSNNKLNTILLKIQSYFIRTKNINQLLFIINTLYLTIKDRNDLFKSLQFDNDNIKSKISPFASVFKYKELEFNYDILFDHNLEKITPLIGVNDKNWNKVLLDLIEINGVKTGIAKLIEHYDGVFR